ncbi:hypothetical protein B5E80_18775 [Flavonifractor sp. An135]|nr:HD-GYP domain-containing protein [Flavonifractor sp. An135]OUQ17042.1 hypothetical protein B5E80_18775 [Flavonifractor sp. An135]
MEKHTSSSWYIGLIVLLGTIAGVYSIFSAVQCQPWRSPSVLLVLVLLCILCRCLPLYIRPDCTIDMSFISILAMVLVFGPETATAVFFLTKPLEIFPNENGKGYCHIFNTAPVKTLFNASNLNLSFTLAGFAYHAAGGKPGNITLPGVLLPAALFILVAIALNSFILLFLFLLEHKVTFYPTILQMFLGLLPSIVCSAPMAYFLAMLLQMKSGVWMALLFMLPLLLARYSFKLYLNGVQQQYSILKTLTAALDAKDTYTEGHSTRVACYATQIASELHLSQRQIRRIQTGAIFHDIGKIGIPDSVLQKPGRLTPEERTVIQRHPVIGVDILKNIDSYSDILDMVLHHHERYDGGGYPDGTRGDEVSLEVYILGAADSYDAITSDRIYSAGRSPQVAARILREEAGKQFHPQVAEVAARMAEEGRLIPDQEEVGTP